jgi:hypothetical protein
MKAEHRYGREKGVHGTFAVAQNAICPLEVSSWAESEVPVVVETTRSSHSRERRWAGRDTPSWITVDLFGSPDSRVVFFSFDQGLYRRTGSLSQFPSWHMNCLINLGHDILCKCEAMDCGQFGRVGDSRRIRLGRLIEVSSGPNGCLHGGGFAVEFKRCP